MSSVFQPWSCHTDVVCCTFSFSLYNSINTNNIVREIQQNTRLTSKGLFLNISDTLQASDSQLTKMKQEYMTENG